jgi:hypothetical protein
MEPEKNMKAFKSSLTLRAKTKWSRNKTKPDIGVLPSKTETSEQ